MFEFHLKWIWSRFLDFYGVDCIELDKLLKIGCLMVGTIRLGKLYEYSWVLVNWAGKIFFIG